MGFNKLITTFFGIGYIGKGAGTVAAVVCCVLLYLGAGVNLNPGTGLLIITVVIFIAGVITAGKVEAIWGKDHQRVVIDEVLGMAVTMLFHPINLITLFAGLVAFRFFDIAKPLFIKRLEDVKGGWGVMLDDLLAGVYANIVLVAISYFAPTGYEGIF